MQPSGNWHDRTVKAINFQIDNLGQKEAKKLKLDLLLRVVEKVDRFADLCGECQLLRQDITTLTEELPNLSLMPKESRKQFTKKIDAVVNHLQKKHGLVRKGHYTGIAIGLGMAVSAGLGAVMEALFGSSAAAGGIGVVAGLLIGRYLDRKAEKEDRLI